MKRKLSYLLVGIMLLQPLVIQAQDLVLSNKELTQRYKEMSNTEEKLKVEHELNEINYKDLLDKNKDFENSISIVEKQIENLENMKQSALSSHEDHKKSDKVKVTNPYTGGNMYISAQDYEMQKFTMAMNQQGMMINQNRTLIKNQLNSYVQMQQLKFSNDTLERKYKLDGFKGENAFNINLLEYKLLQEQVELINKEISMINESINTLKLQLKQGSITNTNIIQKENELSQKQKELVDVNGSLAEKDNSIRRNLKLDDKTPLEIIFTDPEILEPLKYETYYSLVESRDTAIQYQKYMKETYDQLNKKVEYAYKPKDKAYKIEKLKIQKEQLKIQDSLNQLLGLISFNQENYCIAFEKFKLAQSDAELAQTIYNQQLTKYNQGLISHTQFEQAKYDHLKSTYNYHQAIIDYEKAKNKYLESI